MDGSKIPKVGSHSLQHHINLPSEYPLSDLQLRMSNLLVRNAHGLTLVEKRIVASCLAKTDQKRKPPHYQEYLRALNQEYQSGDTDREWVDYMQRNPFNPYTVRISAEDYATAYGVDMSTAYQQLKTGVDSLYQRDVDFFGADKRPNQTNNFRWISSKGYHNGEGWAQISWSPEIVPYIYGVGTEYMEYVLRTCSDFSHHYSWLLLEQLLVWKADSKGYTPTIERFLHSMDAPPTYAKDFAKTREKIIEKAVAELLGKKRALTLEWRPVHSGRRVSSLEFKYELPNPKQGELLLGD